MKDVLGIFVAGANGRMGKNIINLVMDDPEAKLVGATEHPKSDVQGADAGLNANAQVASVTIAADLDRCLQKNRGVIIDFSSVETTLTNLERAEKHKTPMVIGTTGFNDEQIKKIAETAKKIPVVLTPNMSVAMNLLFKLVEDSAKILKNDYDIEVFEAHHRNKVDAPSGTAVRIANILCEATGRTYKQDVNLHREGITGERKKNEIGIQVLRGGDIVGEHTVFFCGMGERLEIKHVATRRRTFAQGAIRAAKWVVNKDPGLYDMQDVLGLKK
jgi:4-hydroxy-tetrahydrodipicolinate reductase